MKKILFALIFLVTQVAFSQTVSGILNGNVKFQTRTKQGSSSMIPADTLMKAAANSSYQAEWVEVRYSSGLVTGSNSKYFDITGVNGTVVTNSATYFKDGLFLRGITYPVIASYMWSGLGTNNDYYFETSLKRIHFPSSVASNYLSNSTFVLRFQVRK